MADLPSLTRSDVRTWTAERFYERGRRYREQGRIRHPRRQGRTLKAECEGSQPAPYRVEAALDAGGIASAECSCPMGEGGYCKHVVALLLTWIDAPGDFTEAETLEALLSSHSKGQLITLVQRMLDRHPDLETMATLSAGTGAPPDADQLRRQVRRTLPDAPGYEYGYGGFHEAAQDLEAFVARGDDYFEHEDWAGAATVYRVTADAILDRYEMPTGEEGEIGAVVNTCAERLGRCLAAAEDERLREQILRALFDIYRWDVDYGGIGMGDAVPAIILREAAPAERRRVATWVRSALPQPRPEHFARNPQTGEHLSWTDSWHRRLYGGFLLDLEADTLDEEAYLGICRQTGRLDDLTARLLEMDRLDEALDALRPASDYDLLRQPDRFAEHGAREAVRRLIEDRVVAAQNPDRRLLAWLREDAAARGDHEAAFALGRRLFWASPSVDAYRHVREAAQKSERWAEDRTALLDRLREEEQWALLTRLHLSEGEIDEALHAAHQTPGTALKLQAARAAEETRPDEAVEIYFEAACDLIERRGRGNYAQAAEHLGRIQHVQRARNHAAAWADLIEAVREENSNLPALQDELDKAGL